LPCEIYDSSKRRALQAYETSFNHYGYVFKTDSESH